MTGQYTTHDKMRSARLETEIGDWRLGIAELGIGSWGLRIGELEVGKVLRTKD